VAQPVSSSLDDSDLVVEPFHEAQRDFILWLAIGGESVPMTIDHVGELLVGFQSLPFERRAPVLQEPSCPALVLVAPELSKGLLENICGVQQFVGAQQSPQCLSALQREVLLVRQQRVVPLDEAAVLSRQSRVLVLSHLTEGFAQVANDE